MTMFFKIAKNDAFSLIAFQVHLLVHFRVANHHQKVSMVGAVSLLSVSALVLTS